MQSLILVRHGESRWNAEGRIQGFRDSPLSELGRRQSRLLGTRLENESLDAAYSSTASRASETGRIAVGDRVTLDERENLCEINLGDWEGELVTDLRRSHPRETTLWFDRPSRVRIENGESLRSFRRRVSAELAKIREENEPDASIAVFTHGGVICVYLTALLGLKLDDLWRFKILNASLTRVIFPNDKPRIAALNDTGHLDGVSR